MAKRSLKETFPLVDRDFDPVFTTLRPRGPRSTFLRFDWHTRSIQERDKDGRVLRVFTFTRPVERDDDD